MNLIELAYKLRPYIEKVVFVLDDNEAIEAKELFPQWNEDNVKYEEGERVRYNDVLYKVIQDHTSQSNWRPDVATTLFAKILIPSNNIIPEWEQPNSTNPYQIGDKVRFEGKVYESLIANNIWSPAVYPAGWREI